MHVASHGNRIKFVNMKGLQTYFGRPLYINICICYSLRIDTLLLMRANCASVRTIFMKIMLRLCTSDEVSVE